MTNAFRNNNGCRNKEKLVHREVKTVLKAKHTLNVLNGWDIESKLKNSFYM